MATKDEAQKKDDQPTAREKLEMQHGAEMQELQRLIDVENVLYGKRKDIDKAIEETQANKNRQFGRIQIISEQLGVEAPREEDVADAAEEKAEEPKPNRAARRATARRKSPATRRRRK